MKYSLFFRVKSYFLYALNVIVGIGSIKQYIKVLAAKRIYRGLQGDTFKSDEADNVIWTYYPTDELRAINEPWDILMMSAVAACKQKFMVYDKPDIGKFHNKNILYNIHKDRLNIFGLENYSAYYQLVSGQLEEQKNNVYPTLHDVLYWENKVYMYQMFDKLGIRTPRTVIYSDFEQLIASESGFPFLIKVPHSSGSYGLFNVTGKDYLVGLKNDPIILANKYFIVQQRLNITGDMRVIIVGGKLIHYYSRINKDKTVWKTTSTSYGSVVDFDFFPEQWRQYLLDAFDKLGLIMGACDIGWENDDFSNPPYFFEVSPSYDINPKITRKDYLENYGAWKKRLLLKGSFDRLFVEETFNIKSKGVAEFFRRIGVTS